MFLQIFSFCNLISDRAIIFDLLSKPAIILFSLLKCFEGFEYYSALEINHFGFFC